MNSNAHPSTATRIVCIAFLSVAFLLSAVLMLFGIGMEGMRHSLPGPDQLDPYYFEYCVPAAFFGLMFLVSLWRLPSLAVIVGSAVAASAALAWLIYEFRKASSPYEFPGISAVIMLLAACAVWRLTAFSTSAVNRLLPIFLAFVAHAFAADPPKAASFGDGIYVGMEPMGNISPDEPKARWFHENTLKITGDAVTLEKSPVWFKDGKKWFSASDGGFYTYRGTMSFADGQWQIELLLADSDYVAVPRGKDGKPVPPKPQRFQITQMKDDSLVSDKVTYRRAKAKHP